MSTDPRSSGPETHLDPDLMADLYDGLLTPDAAESARRHLASCQTCAADFALITQDFGLAGFVTPEPIPAEVAIRIEAALHREPALSAPSAAPQHSAAPRRTRRFRIMVGSLAGASLVIAGVFAGVTALNSGDGGHGATSTAAGDRYVSKNENPPGDSKAGGAQAPNAVAPSSEAAGQVPSAALGLTVEQQAEQLLRQSGRTQSLAGSAAGAGGDSKAESSRFACPPAGFADVSPLATAPTTYQGQPAELLVYAKPGDAATAAVYVIATKGCTPGSAGQVLYTTEVPRR